MFEGWSDLRVLSGVQGSYRQIAAAMAASLAGIAELLDRRTAEELDAALHVRSVITAFDRTAVEVGAALALPSPKARELVRQADALHTRLPGLGALLAAGEVDYDTVA
ncbi:13E12 repeat family protein, partial [Mycolicibacterium gilvum]